MPRRPSDGRVTEAYGPRTVRPTPTSPLFHYGEDSVGYGNRFPVDGVITSAAYVGSYGNRVVIEQGNNRSIHWWLCHNASLPKGYGTWGKEGDFAAPMGATGNVTGVHVHTERRINATSPGTGDHTNPASVYGSTSGGPSTPIDNTPAPAYPNGGNNMYFLRTVDGTINFVTEAGWEPIQSPQHMQLLQRFVKAFPNADTFNAAERDIIYFYIASARDITDAQYRDLKAGLANIEVTVDNAAITAAITKYLEENGVSVDYDKIGEVVDETLADNFAFVNKNIDEQGYTIVPKA